MVSFSSYFDSQEKRSARIKNPIRYSLFLSLVIMTTAMLAITHARGNGTLTNKGIVAIAGIILALLFVWTLLKGAAQCWAIQDPSRKTSDGDYALKYTLKYAIKDRCDYNKSLKDKIQSVVYPIIVYGSIFAIWSIITYNFIQNSITTSLTFDTNKHLPMLILLSIAAAFLIALNITEQKMEIDIFSLNNDTVNRDRQKQLKITAGLYGAGAITSGLALLGTVLALTHFREKIPNFEDHSKALLFAATFFGLIFTVTAMTAIINLVHLEKTPGKTYLDCLSCSKVAATERLRSDS
ncbi:MAG: hypothetical protein OEY79_01000 [Anaplasmataceae bacterium]|nr:hypothetical protein [Anaplasmataceae bacterium]